MIRTANNTLKAIDRRIIETQETPFRKHLGASLIGDECARKLWYIFRWTKAEDFEARMLRLFNRGHLEEARFIGYLRSIGVQVWEAGENGDLKSQMRISDCDGHFGGTPDGVGMGLPDLPPDTPFLLEFKTHGKKSFDKLVAEGLMMSKWKHFVQMQTYMGKLHLAYGLYCAVNKDTDELFMEILSHDPGQTQKAVERASLVIWSKEILPRISKLPTASACKFCHLNRLCWFGDVTPAVNCRTCQWSTPIPGGVWQCNLQSKVLDEAAQREACPRYIVNPEISKV